VNLREAFYKIEKMIERTESSKLENKREGKESYFSGIGNRDRIRSGEYPVLLYPEPQIGHLLKFLEWGGGMGFPNP